MKKHIGSTIALVVGILYFLGSLSNMGSGIISGPIMIIGALAYRSAKQRHLGNCKPTITRKIFEITGLVVIVVAIVFQTNLKETIATDPVPNFIIPLWAIIAYLVIALKKAKPTKSETDSPKTAPMQ